MLICTLLAAATLTAETSNPTDSYFVWKSSATVTFQAQGFGLNETRPLSVVVTDHEGRLAGFINAPKTFTTDAKGEWTGTYDLPTDRLGCFTVTASSGDVKLPKLGTRGEGLLTYAVVHDPDRRPLISQDEAFFGCYGNSRWIGCRQNFAGFCPLADPDEGARRVAEFKQRPWRSWGSIDCSRLLFHVGDPNCGPFYSAEGRAWLKANAGRRNARCEWIWMEPEGEKHLRVALANLMRAARTQMPEGQKFRIYELTSEVNLWISAQAAVRLAQIAREVMDKEDPEGFIAYPGVSPIKDLAYHQKLFKLGLLRYVNCFTTHPYTSYPPEPGGFLRDVRALRALVREYAGHDMMTIGTEAGYAMPGTVEGETAKLAGQLRTNLILLGEGYAFNYAFYGNDFGNDDGRSKDGDYGLNFNLEFGNPARRYGPRKTSPRAISAGLSAASWLLDGKRPTACLEGVFGETTLGYSYADKSNNCVIALWDFGGQASSVRIPVGRDRIFVADVMGNEHEAGTDKGMIELTLGPQPVYVVAPDPGMWGRSGSVAAELAEKARQLKAEREARIKLKVESVEPSFTGETPIAAVTVANRTDARQVVVVETRVKGVPEARHRIRAEFDPKEMKMLEVKLSGFAPSATELVSLQVTAALKDGFRAEKEAVLNFWRAEPAGEDVFNWRPVAHQEVGDAATPVSMAFGWNAQYLICDAAVSDAVHLNTGRGFWSWNGDALQIGLAKQWLEVPSANNIADLQAQACSEITFALTEQGPVAYRTITFDDDRFPAGSDGSGAIPAGECPMRIVRDGNVTRYRIAVPWRYLNVATPVCGQSVRFAAFANDRDGAGGPLRSVQIFDLKDVPPKNFGRLVLGK